MTEDERSYGRSRSGVDLTPEVVERMAAEAEAGLDPSNQAAATAWAASRGLRRGAATPSSFRA
jgi:hypothetical protein